MKQSGALLYKQDNTNINQQDNTQKPRVHDDQEKEPWYMP